MAQNDKTLGWCSLLLLLSTLWLTGCSELSIFGRDDDVQQQPSIPANEPQESDRPVLRV